MQCPLGSRNGPEVILAYVAEGLEADASALFERHMAGCEACREFVSKQQATWRALDLFEAAPVSSGFDRRLYERIEQPATLWDRLIGNPLQEMLEARRTLPLAAAATLLITAGVVWQQHPSTRAARLVTPLTAQIEALRPEQVESALDDMEMVSEFSHPPVSESSGSKM